MVWVLSVSLVSGLALIGGISWSIRERRSAADEVDDETLATSGEHTLLPSNRYPKIDADACIGCGACLAACPEGGVLTLLDGNAVLANPAACVGHGACAIVCPTGALTLHLGSTDRPLALPELDARQQSSRPGIYVAGDLGGAGLIGQAIAQGIKAAQEALRDASGQHQADGIVIVGAGPAGLAAALTLRAAEASFRIIDRDAFGGTIANYPRQKLVMTEPVPMLGLRWSGRTVSKEVLLEHLHSACDAAGLAVEEGTELLSIGGSTGAFVVHTSRGVLKAQRVILATGMQGVPRKLQVPGEELDVVTYRLSDPEQYAGARVLVVGGGNSAMEAAIALAGVAKTQVTLAHRSPLRGRSDTQRTLAQQAADKRLRIWSGVQVKDIAAGRVRLQDANGVHTRPFDYILVQAGGTLPGAFLRALNLRLTTHSGNRVSVPPPLSNPGTWVVAARRLGWALNLLMLACAGVTLGCLACLAWSASSYYVATATARSGMSWDSQLKPAGGIGRLLGVSACMLMLGNLLYVLRKRLSVLSGSGSLSSWLASHMVTGTVVPLCVALHAGFYLRNAFGWAVVSLLMVGVLTGLFGRFLAGASRRLLGLTAPPTRLLSQLAALHRRMAEQRSSEGIGLGTLPAAPVLSTTVWASCTDLWRAQKKLRSSDAAWLRYRSMYAAYLRGRLRLAWRRSITRALYVWRALHVLSAVAIFLLVLVHVSVMAYLGFLR